MAEKIKLTIDGKEFPLISCQYSVFRDADHTGKPAGPARSGQISISRESSEDFSFYEWSTDDAVRKSGSITFFKMSTEESLKTLEFENGFIVSYVESCMEGNQIIEDITISVQKITIDGTSVDNQWPPGV